MALWLACTVVATLLGASSAARSGDFGRSLQQSQSPAMQSAMCGSQGYIVGQSYCVYIPTGTGVAAWICPVEQPCACPTTQTGRNPFDCYNPTQYSCSTSSPNWPQSGLIKALDVSDAGACGSGPSVPSMAPAPARGPGPGPGQAPASAPFAEPAPAM